MIDPLAEVVSLLQPRASFSKVVSGAGRWSVHRSETGRPFYCVILEGSSRLAVTGRDPIILEAGDFVLIPAQPDFTMSSLDTDTAASTGVPNTTSPPTSTAATTAALARTGAPPIKLSNGEFRHGIQTGPPDVRSLIGYCVFGSPDAALLISLLPQLVHVRGEKRLATLVQLVGEESREMRPARDVVLARLLEVLLIEALRSTAGTAASPGLVRGLADARLANAIRQMHANPTRSWTVAELAKEAALSRSAFFERFVSAVGVAPMEYLLAWRMALAKDMLRRKEGGVAEVAERVGYSSGSTFSVAFTRYVGMPPTTYARKQAVTETTAAPNH
jgi:AraC-like DNA-binding protein